MKQFILVAGVNYENFRTRFAVFSRGRMAKLRRVHRTEDLRFILLDVMSGAIETYDVVHIKGQRKILKNVDTSRFQRVTHRNYRPYTNSQGEVRRHTFNYRQAGVMSIVDIYQLVQQIGAGPEAGTLVELSFFSHGWYSGPILVNSDLGLRITCNRGGCRGTKDPSFQHNGLRDPLDHDPRNRDFNQANMSLAQRTQFQGAFHPQGYIWNWGCALTADYHQVLNQLTKSRNYRRTGLDDSTRFRFRFNREQAADFFGRDPFFPPPNSSRTFERDLRQIKDYFRRGLKATYSGRIATAANVKTYGSLLGTSSIFERNTMRVDNQFRGYLRFYRNYLSIQEDPERRGYGAYLP